VPASSRLVMRGKKNRRRPGSLWSRLPKPALIADACGRAVRRSVPALAAVAAVGATCTAVWAGYRFLTHSPRFAVDEISVRGTHHLDPAAVRAMLPIHAGENIFSVSTDAVARAARANPWVASVDARRVLPHMIVVEIREHEAASVVAIGDAMYLADADGHAFKRADLTGGDADGLPIVTGLDRATYLADPAAAAAQIRSAVAALTAWKSADRPAIGEVHVGAHGALTLHTYDPAIAVELGAPAGPALATRMATFDAAWAELSPDERARARAIHVAETSDHVTVAFAKD